MSRDQLFETVRALLELHSPSGVEHEIDAHLLEALAPYGTPRVDGAGNIILSLSGPEAGGEGKVALLAHKDEIGGLVKRVEEGGRLIAQTLGDAHPWIWGEGPVEVLGRHDTVLGVLSFGARHVSDESPQRKQLDDTPVKWKDAWIETKLSAEALEAAGVTVGSRIVPARWRKRPVRLGDEGEYVACHALDDKVAVAMLLELAGRLDTPNRPLDLVFTTREEVGCQGSQYYARSTDAVAIVALEVVPVAKELADAAAGAGVTVHHAAVTRYGSDASSSLDSGRVPRSACLAAATENTHGFEIAHLDAIDGCVRILHNWLG
jgi:putative aminopeptidase FrvX